jgi:hypothetical protein
MGDMIRFDRKTLSKDIAYIIWEDNIKLDLGENGWEGVDCIQVKFTAFWDIALCSLGVGLFRDYTTLYPRRTSSSYSPT